MIQLQGMIAEYERTQIAELTRRGKAHRAPAGLTNVLGGAPYDYRYVRRIESADARLRSSRTRPGSSGGCSVAIQRTRYRWAKLVRWHGRSRSPPPPACRRGQRRSRRHCHPSPTSSDGGRHIFVSLEDETGLVNVVCSKGVWVRYRRVARSASATLIRGKLEKSEGTLNVVAERIEALSIAISTKSRDFR